MTSTQLRFGLRTRTALCAVALLCSGLLCSGCRSLWPPRDEARRVVEELQDATQKREAARAELVRGLIIHTFEGTRARQEALLAERRATATVRIYQLSEREVLDLMDDSSRKLDIALQPVLAKLKADIDEQSRLLASGEGGSEAERTQLQVQLAATVATLQSEMINIRKDIQTKVNAKRGAALDELNEGLDGIRDKDLLDPAAEADKVFDQIQTEFGADPFLAAMDKGYTEVLDYVNQDSAPVLVLKGLLGDGLGARLADIVENKSQSLFDGFVSDVQGKLGELSTDLTPDLAASR